MSDDKIAEIKERHFHDERWRNGPSMGFETICPQTHDDRAFLLAEVDRQRAEIERFREALTDIANQETTGPSKWQLVVARLCEIARETLEGKP